MTWEECSSGEWKILMERVFAALFELSKVGRMVPRKGRDMAQVIQPN